jgi:hypothetical protein
MKSHIALAVAAAIGLTLSGCSNMQSASRDTDQSSSSSSGTMRRAESGSNTTPNSSTRSSDCLPGDARTNCQERADAPTQPDSEPTPDGSPTDAPTSEPETAPVPR